MDLKELKNKLQSQSIDHKQYESCLTYIYYIFGSISTLLMSIVTVMTGIKSLDLLFIFTLVPTLINTLVIFFRLTDKISIHHSYSSDCEDIKYDIEYFLLEERTEDEIKIMKKNMIQVLKRHADREPDLSNCVLKIYNI